MHYTTRYYEYHTTYYKILRIPYYEDREAKLKSLSRNDSAGPKVITDSANLTVALEERALGTLRIRKMGIPCIARRFKLIIGSRSAARTSTAIAAA